MEEWGTKYDGIIKSAKNVFLERHKKYGTANIAIHKEVGVLVRITDKVMRLNNAFKSNKLIDESIDESIEDTWMDIINYAVIALMCRKGLWKEKPEVIP